MNKLLTLIAMFAALCTMSTLAQKNPKQDPWKQAGADDSLRKAFEKAIYSLKESGHGTGTETWSGTNDTQRLSMQFDAHESRLTHPDGSVGFHLSGYGYGKKLNTPTAPKLAGDGTRLEYRRGNFTEWYVNSRKGLEQGFTLSQRPAGANNGQPLTIALGVTGTLSLSQQDGAVLLKSGKSTVLRYGGLSARDALDRAIPAHMEARNNEIRLVVDDQQAKYPLTVDPTWSQSQELTTPDPNSLDSFGISVSVSGPIAVIGAPEYWVNGHPGAGAAFVYIQSGSTWTLEQELSAWNANDPNYNFGCSVAVSGTTALIGECGGPDNRGAAYVFVHAGNSWSRQAELTSSDGVVNDQFGASVALSGTTAVIGATGLGSAYIFVQNGTTWTEQQELSGYGSLVSVSGITVVIGEASQIVGGNTGQGAAYVFVRDGQTWSQQQELTSSDGAAGDGFGGAVAVSGTMAVIGAPGKEIDGNYEQGAAYIFAQNGTTWSQQQELNASDGAVQDVFGGSVALSGTTAVIGAYGKEYSQGAAYVFVSSNGIWNQQQELSGGDSSHFGNSVGVIGPTLLIGAYGTNQGAGAAYVFTEGPAVPATLTTPSPGSALTSTSVEFTWSAVTGASATYDLHLSAVAPGGYDLYLSGHIAGTSTTATNLPINGGTIYARLYTFINGVTYYNDYTYTAMSVLLAQLTSPAPSSTLTSNPVNFTWSAGTAGSQYDLHLSAVAPDGYDLYLSGHITGTSTTVNGLPTNGEKIYARLYTIVNGVTVYNDYTYTAMSVSLAKLTSPFLSSTLTSNSIEFTWSAGTAGSLYDLHLSAVAPGGYDLYLSGHIAGNSTTVNGLPVNGEKIYARLYTILNGATVYNDYTYTAASIAKLISPVPSSTFTGASVKFTWSAGAPVSQYDLRLSAIAFGGYDLYATGHLTSTSKTVTGLPTNGEIIYARLYTFLNGVTFYNDYAFKAQ